jgi:hypothetical protein
LQAKAVVVGSGLKITTASNNKMNHQRRDDGNNGRDRENNMAPRKSSAGSRGETSSSSQGSHKDSCQQKMTGEAIARHIMLRDLLTQKCAHKGY